MRDRQPLSDHSRKALAKEHQQLGAVPSVEAELSALSKSKQPARQRRLAIDPDQSLGANQVASWSEQRVAPLDGAHMNSAYAPNLTPEKRGIDVLNACPVGPKALAADY